MVCVYTAAYCAMFEMVRGMHITLTAQLADTLEGILIAVATLLLCAAYFAHACKLALLQHKGRAFGMACAAFAAVHLVAYAVATSVTPAVKVHLHHQWWGFAVSFVAQSSTSSRACAIGQAMSIGIHLHGLAAFGSQPIFKI
eukprot:TRINITY_DN72931_c0_g1_i1.p2 TRINITY_DN72931_c0_g1~~TRINITY_DN72931_c0_g1_i1.p2  ORF type:complete len:167 (+),score=49.43 TRINITY_DN72931_c0_g1_i1:78-503(+)